MIESSRNIKNCWQDLTFAPAISFKTANINKEELWEKIASAAKGSQTCAGLTGVSDKVDWPAVNLTSRHYYTIIDAQVLAHKLGSSFKVLKIRNAFKNENYQGEGSLTDTIFWDHIEASD
jgi:hypothetical protein